MKTTDFPPPRQRGAAVHLALIAALAAVAAAGAWLATGEPIGLRFTLYILLAGLAFFPLPLLAYRLWALLRAGYRLDRDSVTIAWGLRVERIPMAEVEWVRPAAALRAPLPLPPFRLPGAILGSRRVPDIGWVEFLASESASLLLVAVRGRAFAISPADPHAFVQTIQRALEMGSLTPAESQSIYPAFLVGEAWQDRLARYLWLAGLFVNIGLLAWVSLIIPSLGPVPLGFLASGAPGEPVPAAGLILLPVISLFFFALGWLAGLIFYRQPDQRPLAHIVWASGLVMSMLFLAAVMFLVTAPV